MGLADMRRIAEIAEMMGAGVLGDPGLVVRALAEPGSAGPHDLALAMSPRYAQALAGNDRVQAAVVWDGADIAALGLKAAIVVARPRLAMAQLTQAFDVASDDIGQSRLADIAPDAKLDAGVQIGAFTSIGAGVRIGPATRIADHVSIAAGVTIGAGCIIHPGVRLGRNVSLGDRVILQPNVVIGGDGFSFVTATPSHPETGRRTLGKTPFQPMDDAVQHRIHSLGGVQIDDDVEVGANSTIDAGTIRATRVGGGTKIDNLVQIGHNVQIGADCLVCAHAAIAGSTVIGDRAVLGGKSAVADNLTLGSDIVLGGAAVVLADLPDGSFMMGYPAQPMLTYRRQQRALRDLANRQIGVSKTGQND